MIYHQPYEVVGFHGCDKTVGLKVVLGETELRPSMNRWDWLGNGIYFWEQNPLRALHYAIANASGKQFNRIRIKEPFVLGADIILGNCLNLVESRSLQIVTDAYLQFYQNTISRGMILPENKESNRELDCAVIKYIHFARQAGGQMPYDTVRSPFSEGGEVYPGTSFSRQGHIQVCVMNPDMIRAYFLPRPVNLFNPYLHTSTSA